MTDRWIKHKLSVSENTVRTRLREISPLLAADLDHPTVQAQLLLALRVPPLLRRPPRPHARFPARRCPPNSSTPTRPRAGHPPCSNRSIGHCVSHCDAGSSITAAPLPQPPSWDWPAPPSPRG
ncbi:helix-turn-helix domain-containing protein [Streptomyces sp. NBC_01808]|uniref:helix-turn-helix domain-containing protein n=1 Tax=Streptomyces sp. NBC_01808 TaxID=2975947 RepID=UPI003FA36115